MSKLTIANWKMNPRMVREAVRLARASDARGVVIAPPFPFLPAVGRTVNSAALGAQDVFWESEGAYTGGVSPAMLKALGVRYVIVGHSERRAHLGETDDMVAKKVAAALRTGLTPVLCVGEPLTVRRKGLTAAKRFVAHQLRADLRGVRSLVVSRRLLVIAYEPVWAIGTGRSATPKDASAMAQFIKKLSVVSCQLSVKVLYGGSVDARNVGAFLAEPAIDGALVGGASLKPREFKKMISIAEGYN
ncbi:MAG: triose-phosphate isomerase [Candidatus Jorgensenbacteria bacterium]